MERFVLKDVVEVPKMGLRALKYHHKPTNLTHLHVEKKGDSNRVFSLAFKTDAPDKTGVPHILEHTTLCGSEKFPVRDPFFKMLNRSLANFMNAMTGFDYTFYPFATTNKADFFNLQKVYMDSVFSPLLKEQDFQQEGWRLEPENMASENESPLIFKGVVYNEMKGQMSMPAYQHYMAWFMSIYPSMQYSAGDPQHIPDLKYEDLVKFHRDHYHPGNCFTFSYGDFEAHEALEPLVEYLDKSVKRGYKPQNMKSVPQPIKLVENVYKKAFGPLDPMFDENKQQKISLTWYVGSTSDLSQILVWKILGILLTDGHASPFYQALIDSGIGSEFSGNTGVEETPARLMFTVGLQGCEPSKIPQFKKAVSNTIDDIIQNGFPQQRVDAILHQADFGDREVDANYGMGVLNKVVSRAFHPNDDFMKIIDNEKLLGEFKDQLAKNPKLLQDVLAKSLSRSQPYFEFEMAPSSSYESNLAESEKKRLADKLADMTDEDISRAVTQAKDLEMATKSPQNLDVLPSLSTADIALEPRTYPAVNSTLGSQGVECITRETSTQGITYVRLMRDLSSIPHHLLPYLLIYTDALTNVGTLSHSMAEFEDLIKMNTGNLSVSAAIQPWGSVELIYGASALESNLPKMYQLFTELSSEPKLDNLSKLKVILEASAANITNSLSQSGHRYAVSRASAALSSRKAAEDALSGFAFVKLVQELSMQSEDQLRKSLLPNLEEIHNTPWVARSVGLTHSPSSSALTENKAQLETMLKNLSAIAGQPAPGTSKPVGSEFQSDFAQKWPLQPAKTMVSLPSFQVSHVGVAVQGCKENISHKDHAALQVLANLMSHKHLHTELREKGGAYGGGASYNATDGLFTMFSYRDPTPDNTRKVMLNSATWAVNHKFSDHDLEEGKIGIFQSIDRPISPRSEILGHLGRKTTLEERKLRRQNLLTVTPEDVNRVAEKYLLPNLRDEAAHAMCVIGPDKPPSGWSSIGL